MKKIYLTITLFSGLLIWSCTKDATTAVDCTTVSAKYSTNVAKTITAKCGGTDCHNSTYKPLSDYTKVKAYVDNGVFKSRVIDNKSMPPASSPQLTAAEFNALSCWVSSGAPNN